ncbi:PLDc N-terminal domain-containing protein [Levilactobacillus namurensis]|uniref:PLDc N-terminal domain-containing protein n=1 Tax=Levilactobacillus namurensis TaxID=380393 RepID=A0AAW8W7Y4_9LACO|nr:PLDc N-terminal domain-containing protein [Levilactobacillus namurensis]MDT7014456.1 PLDc N-terminal domain-containing protein [Levilactobacillus namurensis]
MDLNETQFLIDYWPTLLPVAVLEVSLMLVALKHIFQHTQYRFGNRVMWVAIVVIFQIIGPVVYFTWGKGTANDE